MSSSPGHFAPNVPALYSSLHQVKSLVCDRCWNQVFNTANYQRMCLAERDTNNSNQHYTSTTKTTAGYVQGSSKNGCSWCAFLWTFLSRIDESQHDIVYNARLSYSGPDPTAHNGTNKFYFTLDSNLGRGWSLLLSAYTLRHDKAARYVTARPLQRNVSSPEASKQITSWIQDCGHHESCLSQAHVELPKRVIQVNPKENQGQPRLMFSNGLKGKYAALSYSWGAVPSRFLTTANIEEYTRGIDMEKIPLTIRDAILVAESISIDYIWIDALCIVQDSQEDKVSQLAKMESIYRNSLVTIVAAIFKDVNNGFLQDRVDKPLSDKPCGIWTDRRSDGLQKLPWTIPFRIDDGVFGTMTLECTDCETTYDESKEVVNKRAWTVQEQLMAPRLLFYGSHTLQWRCRAGTRNLDNAAHVEKYTQSTVTALSHQRKTQRESLLRWLHIVEMYSSREISLPSDKLPALAGIAKEVSILLGPSYYAGIWGDNNLVRQLSWYTYANESRPTAPKDYRAPTWSWASVQGPVVMRTWDEDFDKEEDDPKPVCEVLRIATTLKNSTLPFGEVNSGHLILRGKIRQGWLIESKEEDEDHTIVWCSENISSGAAAEADHIEWVKRDEQAEMEDPESFQERIQQNPWARARYDTMRTSSPILVTCVLLYEDFGLILSMNNQERTYQRIGSFDNTLTQMSGFEYSLTEEITII
ncbi:HET-domain-containing protein [Pleomassaria siparia CBS 279.74]|uniref:HET-domain-containing protein n=1 Tax=Pleomassaria siparia CBS 279.74 TaxID=1314801 RepID=A0A6G1K850_9PLEO|nr:HET-domain-containing protein [Pleomassaria siparia CBS 279.74]